MKNNILEVKNLSKVYHSLSGEVNAIENFNLSVKEGEFISIIGTSGCGKSTILNILAGLDNDYNGTVDFKDNIKVGYMLQEDALFDFLNVLDNALIGLKIKHEVTIESINYVKSLLIKYGLKDFMYKKPTSLSGGMRQRVSLIRTLATKPDLLLLDEAFSKLDYVSRLKVTDDVYNIIKEEKKTTIIVTHDISEAISISKRIIVLSKRPSKIKNIYEIKLTDKKNPIHNRKAPEFASYYDILWKDIDDDE
ncbi:MAG: ATP-binding cassette domain-containing protein [Bacilli bacterium]